MADRVEVVLKKRSLQQRHLMNLLPTITLGYVYPKRASGPMSFSKSQNKRYALLQAHVASWTDKQCYEEMYVNAYGQVHTHIHIHEEVFVNQASPMQEF